VKLPRDVSPAAAERRSLLLDGLIGIAAIVVAAGIGVVGFFALTCALVVVPWYLVEGALRARRRRGGQPVSLYVLWPRRQRAPVVLAAALPTGLGLLFAGCAAGEERANGAKAVNFKITDAGCEPHDASLPAGPIAFEAESESSTVTEIEVLDGEAILGEKENLTEGLSGGFQLTLDEGEYTLRCNGGTEEDGR
jgi:hypothetical protein